jgi:hypothetical protein
MKKPFDNTPITPEALIEMGFISTARSKYSYDLQGYDLQDIFLTVYFYDNIIVDLCTQSNYVTTNATTIEDIKDLIRLFK